MLEQYFFPQCSTTIHFTERGIYFYYYLKKTTSFVCFNSQTVQRNLWRHMSAETDEAGPPAC